jgi:predicted nucleic acid-binding protein
MIIVADTSPLNYLVQIQRESLLGALYKKVIIPEAVFRELSHSSAPWAVSQWLLHVPGWIEVRGIVSPPDTSLAWLGPGEREAIQLAQEQHADLLLIDERRGRLEARRRGLTTTGTIGVLLAAGEMGLVDPATLYQRLISETSFRVAPELEKTLLARFRQIRKNGI